MNNLTTRLLLNFIITLAISLCIAIFITFQVIPSHIAKQISNNVQKIAQSVEEQQLSEDAFQNELFQFSLTNISYQSMETLQNSPLLSNVSKKKIREGQAVEGDDTSKDLVYIYPIEIHSDTKYLQFILKQTIFKNMLKSAFILLSKITLFVGIGLNIFTSIQIVRPIRKLKEYTAQFAKGNFTFKHTKNYSNEIDQLYESFGTMSNDLEKMLQSQKDFVSNISHEFQTPLTSIKGFTKALQQKEMSREKQLYYLRIIEHESARLSQLSRNVLKLSSLQNGTQPLEKRTFDLAEQLRQVIISLEPHWATKAIEFDVQIERSIIEADELLLYQVWYNLINNAIHFTPENCKLGLTLRSDGEHYTIQLEDEGPGIEQPELDRVKEPFYKAKNQKSTGNGLGLSIVENIVRKHHGTFQLENYERGLRVTVILPHKNEATN
ncbi:HAMP domain-containing sensor histidine kinase [Viridibacillus sp. FSL R5-0477]|uniref:histidine kinase n=3 Tax=Viridibacillus TaxID=496496 RepID=W4F292_9BACL|nr:MULTISPECIES: HAMP domain-containing sensor histidine kinase [Viridibacillus]ETT86584.1 histidine kinase [Viridibacillus arenosi FSL R5-213]OMC85962.1 two-component sensor histidine kinase [Viridibacillus sp. FSL H7-0596]